MALAEVRFGIWVTGTSTRGLHFGSAEPTGQTGWPPGGGVSTTVAALRIVPALASAGVTRYVPVSTQVAPGTTIAQVVVFGVILSSVTTTLPRSMLPMLVTVIV
jgi:hypothetical protein